MKKKSLVKDTLREIRKSLGRFFSIMVIVSLGVAFLAGIKVSAPLMRDTTDQYMDDYHMMDLMVLSTLGLEKADVEAIRQLSQVENVVGSHIVDTLVNIDGNQHVVKVHSLQDLAPEDEAFVNQPKLIEGRWPSASDECLIDGTQLTRLPVEIGDTITLATGTDEGIDDVLNHEQYKVVGVVNSPYYMHFERGSSEIGNGSVSSFIYIPEGNFKSEIYTEIFITLKGARALNSYGDGYKALVEDFKSKLEPIMEERADVRYETLLKNGQAEIEDGQTKLAEEKEKANTQLQEAADELEKAQQQIEESEQDLASRESQVDEGFKQAEVAIKNSETQLIAKEKEYEENSQLFNEQKEIINQELEEAENELNEGHKQLQSLKEELANVETLLAEAEEQDKALLMERKQTLETQINELEPVLQASQETYETSLSDFKTKEELMVVAKTMLAQGKEELAQQKAALQNKKEESLKQLSEGRSQLEEAKVSLQEGQEQYNASKLEAEAQFKEAEEKIEKGKEALENLKVPKVYLLGREANYGVANYKSAADTIDRMGQVFPLFFFVVAALVCLTTMTRMVDEQRTTIGTYKALGYSSLAIMSKYILYAGLASLLGSLLGIIVGFKVFPNTIYGAYAMTFTVPLLLSKFYPMAALSATFMMTGLTIFATVFATVKSLKEQPSELMRPKAPAVGKRILLECIPFIWKKMNFFQKVVARNIFRYKKKFLMTTIGISGCTALLVAGLGLKQSVISIVGRQYGDIFKYHLEVTLKEDAISQMADSNTAECLKVSNQNIKVIYGEAQKDIALITIPDLSQLPDFIKLQDRVTKAPLSVNTEGVILSEKLAKALDVNIGDIIQFEDSDLETYKVQVAGITENYIGHYMYMSEAYAQQVTGTKPVANQILIRLDDLTSEQEESISQKLTQNEEVVSFAFTTKHAESFGSMTASLDTVMLILIISAALLAFVVLYNLTTINISERYREIATIKVLGFNDFKVSQYIYRENIVLTLMGGLLGMLLGKALFLFIIITAEMDELMFARELYASSYITAMILTFAFSMVVNLIMYFKLKKIEMVESLKSVE